MSVEYKSYSFVGYKGIFDGRVEANLANRVGVWRFWCAYCKTIGIDPDLEEVDFQNKTRVATVFAGRVQKVSHSR